MTRSNSKIDGTVSLIEILTVPPTVVFLLRLPKELLPAVLFVKLKLPPITAPLLNAVVVPAPGRLIVRFPSYRDVSPLLMETMPVPAPVIVTLPVK